MGPVKSEKEVEILREGGRKLAAVLERVIEAARPGVSAFELDRLAEKLIREAGGEPSFKGYKTAREVVPYPATLCISVNDEVVHGFPSRKKIIKEGDVVGIDIGMKYKNLFTDMAKTIIIGEGDKEARRLVEATRKALEIGIAEGRAGGATGDIGAAIQKY
ncbi:MAG: M24 family metallopeptidase, partial [Patescibacteria group bacterium]